MKKPTSIAQFRFLHPKYWLTWLGYAIIYLIVYLPHNLRMKIGAVIGLLGYLFANRRRHIVDVNLQLCFPELSMSERGELNRKIFRSVGISIIETGYVWIRSPALLKPLVTINGLENLQKALGEGKGVILLGMHLSTLDLCGAVLSTMTPFDVMYRRNKNELLEAIMTRGRERNHPAAIQRKNVRAVIKRLKNGHAVWYGPDQDYGRKHSLFAPFFGVPAASITATARIARITKAPVIVFTHYRKADNSGYEVFLSEPVENFPSNEAQQDAITINQLVEEAIRTRPEQYWWLHRRFKTRPNNEARPY